MKEVMVILHSQSHLWRDAAEMARIRPTIGQRRCVAFVTRLSRLVTVRSGDALGATLLQESWRYEVFSVADSSSSGWLVLPSGSTRSALQHPLGGSSGIFRRFERTWYTARALHVRSAITIALLLCFCRCYRRRCERDTDGEKREVGGWSLILQVRQTIAVLQESSAKA